MWARDTASIPAEVYQGRRRKLMTRLGDGVLVLPTAPNALRNGDVHQPFRPGSAFHYLTGFPEPDGILVVRRRGRELETTVFVQPKDKEREIWDGRRYGPVRAKKVFGWDAAHNTSELRKELGRMLDEQLQAGKDTVFHCLGIRPELDRTLQSVFQARMTRHRRRNPPRHPTLVDPLPALNELRCVKDRHEIEALTHAAEISAAGHRVAMAVAQPGMFEYEVQAEMEAVFRRGGSPRNGYESIVASGANACILHYISNDKKLKNGDLLLIDAGAEVDGYTADITRTFPVGGVFSDAQRKIYSLVLRAQEKGIEAAVVGAPWDAPHKACVKALTKGLIDLGLIKRGKGGLSAAIKDGAYRPFYMHGTSHWLGRDVHDTGPYEDLHGQPITLRAGMVLTIEPGLYFDPGNRQIPTEYRGIGIRIEDDILITRGAPRILTGDVPKSIDAIEALCAP